MLSPLLFWRLNVAFLSLFTVFSLFHGRNKAENLGEPVAGVCNAKGEVV